MPKSRKNAFSFFLESYCAEEEAKGRKIRKRDAVDECGPLWTSLTEEGKEVFRIMARREKEKRREARGLSEPSCSTVWENPAVKALEEEKAAIAYLESVVRNEDDVRNRLFYTIHVNHYCMVNKNKYLPGELAVCEFNLQEGVKRKMNILINPGKIPLGFAYEVKKQIQLHGLPHPADSVPSNLKQISEEILEFMEPTKDEINNYPPLFTRRFNIQASTIIINELITPGGSRHKLKVYDAENLLYWLNKKCATYGINEPYPSKSRASYDLDKDLFEYIIELCCPFHTNSENQYFQCSLSHVQRIVFSVCQPCCYLLSIPLIPGDHKPGRPSDAVVEEVPPEEIPGAAEQGDDVNDDD